MVRRDYLITRSYRLSFALEGFYGLLGLAAYYFISRAVGDPAPETLQGAPSYFAFAAVGMAIGVVVEAASGGIARRVREEQLTGTLEALVTQPLRPSLLCLGLVGFPFLFGMVRAVAYLAVAAAWIDLDLARVSWIGMVAVLCGTGLALAVVGIVGGAVVLVIKRGEFAIGAAVAALVLLGGSVFPITVLPSWLESFARVLPLRFSFDGMREALFVGAGWGADALALLAFGLIGVPAAIALFSRALDRSRRAGSLSQY